MKNTSKWGHIFLGIGFLLLILLTFFVYNIFRFTVYSKTKVLNSENKVLNSETKVLNPETKVLNSETSNPSYNDNSVHFTPSRSTYSNFRGGGPGSGK